MRTEILNKIMSNNTSKVSLVGMNITDQEILEIIQNIQKVKPNVSKIDLDNNQIKDDGAKILGRQLVGLTNMQELSLQFNCIGREGALSLFALKNTFPGLDILFHGNKITRVDEMDEIERLAQGVFLKIR